jgi:hypothetical protein
LFVAFLLFVFIFHFSFSFSFSLFSYLFYFIFKWKKMCPSEESLSVSFEVDVLGGGEAPPELGLDPIHLIPQVLHHPIAVGDQQLLHKESVVSARLHGWRSVTHARTHTHALLYLELFGGLDCLVELADVGVVLVDVPPRDLSAIELDLGLRTQSYQ